VGGADVLLEGAPDVMGPGEILETKVDVDSHPERVGEGSRLRSLMC
jgi:hypothetical protein